MLTPAIKTWRLVRHPGSSHGLALQIIAVLAREQGLWRLVYSVQGELSALRLPEVAAHPAAVDGLWHHTCFEAFVAGAGDAYHEFNFSPSGHWAAYAFTRERVRQAAARPLPPVHIHCAREARRLVLSAWLPDAALPLGSSAAPLGLSAVIETGDGHLSYWALHHPAPRPDFHARSGWIARWPLTG
ncbi:hypothetical protein EBQ25_06460 [Allofranklinella schreckenbergeri]|uniref:DOMON-like domain-containing protein n=1 Tax=Allofranklinella schreckenbergeri TaxID=1076744 RepID=A0A3M6Q944_9BURK|nr:DOMON-like domain-containing protein [Allofranklinella schreckenbergeri]RMW99707.1 hypothetical protein EBQ25_06460 [Allofranklinella schreckenbergeri]